MNTINNKTWSEVMKMALQKREFNGAMNQFMAEPFMKRMILTILGKKPRDPYPGYEADGLATRYVQIFDETYHCGKRIEIGNGDTLFWGLRFWQEDLLPSFDVTFYHDGTAYSLRMKFLEDGGIEYCKCLYPYSEFGITMYSIDQLPDDERPEYRRAVALARRMQVEIPRILNNQ